MKTKLNNQKGFTIIEVLIVLAIAGLILLIVFLAVPALQRNSRNTQRTSDVSRVLGAAQEVLNNNNGSMTALTSVSLRAALGTPAYYLPANISVVAGPAAAGTNGTTTDTIILYTSSTCPAAGTAGPGASRQLAVAFTVEPAAPRCTSS